MPSAQVAPPLGADRKQAAKEPGTKDHRATTGRLHPVHENQRGNQGNSGAYAILDPKRGRHTGHELAKAGGLVVFLCQRQPLQQIPAADKFLVDFLEGETLEADTEYVLQRHIPRSGIAAHVEDRLLERLQGGGDCVQTLLLQPRCCCGAREEGELGFDGLVKFGNPAACVFEEEGIFPTKAGHRPDGIVNPPDGGQKLDIGLHPGAEIAALASPESQELPELVQSFIAGDTIAGSV